MSGAASQIARLARAFPRQPIDQGTFDVYIDELAEVPPRLLASAVTVLIRTEKTWFPSIATIRYACAELELGLPSEVAALTQIEARMRWGREREGDIPAVHAVVLAAVAQVGGFGAFRASEGGVVRGQFGRVFRSMRAEAIRDAQLSPSLSSGLLGLGA